MTNRERAEALVARLHAMDFADDETTVQMIEAEMDAVARLVDVGMDMIENRRVGREG